MAIHGLDKKRATELKREREKRRPGKRLFFSEAPRKQIFVHKLPLARPRTDHTEQIRIQYAAPGKPKTKGKGGDFDGRLGMEIVGEFTRGIGRMEEGEFTW